MSFRFAIMGAGKIAGNFCDAVSRLKDCEVAAVSSKSLDRAEKFAEENHIKAFYEDYRQMLEEEKPDCVYIATVPNYHFELAMLCLDYHVPVICEKAMFMNSAEAEKVFERSRTEGIFVMEALWSRFLPAVRKAKEWLDQGKIGKAAFCETNIGFLAPEGKDNRYHCAALGGGAARDILVYCVEVTTMMFEDPILDIQASAVWEDTGVDLTDHVMLRYPDAIASLTATFGAAFDEHLMLTGPEGRIVLPHPHYASEAYLYSPTGELVEHFKDNETENGFVYEIQEVMDCVRAGKTESHVVPHESTLMCARIFDKIDSTKDR